MTYHDELTAHDRWLWESEADGEELDPDSGSEYGGSEYRDWEDDA